MICPNCKVGINLELNGQFQYPDFEKDYNEEEDMHEGYGIAYGWCPECDQFIVVYKEGFVTEHGNNKYYWKDDLEITSKVIFPKYSSRSITAEEVTDEYKNPFNEAASVLALSPMASAAISRRTLQHVLRNVFNVKKGSLAAEIEEFIHRPEIPSYISEAVDAVRNVGNFAAHPLKDTNTGEIVEVEPGEADWLLEVLESLYDFAFIQPKRLESRRERLNKKLAAIGKPEMKSPNNA